MLGEPPPTQADLHFKIFDIPVRISPFFWVLAIVLGLRDPDPIHLLIWVGAVFVSILVHEMGHALMIRRYGYRPWITLHQLGGLASYNPYRESPQSKIAISLAGPAAGFLLASLIIAIIAATGHLIGFRLFPQPVVFEPYGIATFGPVDYLIFDLLFVNIFWSVANLLPIYPLDGGQVARELFVVADSGRGIQRSLWLSIFTAVACGIIALRFGEIFITVLCGFLAYSSWATLQAYQGRGGGFGPW